MAVRYVEYIKSNGNAYFDTGVKAKSTLRVKMKAQMLDNSISTPFLFGARNSGTDSAFCFFYHTSASAWRADYQTSNNRYTFDTTAVPKTGELEIDFNKNVWTVNGVSKTFTAATFTSNYNLVLFANNTAGTIADHCPALIEYCQIYDNDVLIKDYKSAVDPDGVACFYDKVSETYEYGIGTFTAGASISGGGGGDDSLDYHDNFADNDWATIAKVCKAGLMPTTWKVGDQKAMTINGTSYLIDIIGIQHDNYADGSGKAPFTFQMHDCYNTKYAMNSTSSNVGGWKNSQMRNTHLPAILALMPNEVQTAIKGVNKLTSVGNQISTIETTADKLFLLSEIEVWNNFKMTYSGEGTQYSYYSAGNSKVKKVNGTAVEWWNRSPTSRTTYSYCIGGTDGQWTDYRMAAGALGVSFAFCF